ncbi:MAG: 4Fe-4S binding protein [Negativicutes bacterium]|jgi:MinD superfamily P-loop ATPase
MKSIAVLSGKGGVGKTFVAVNLAYAAKAAIYIDCDVEEPNGHLFFKPLNYYSEEVSVTIPAIAADLCSGCRACVDFCQYNALAYAGNKVLVFDELCHYCGGCALVCPTAAICESSRTIGTLIWTTPTLSSVIA